MPRNNKNNKGVIRPYADKLISLYQLIDTCIIGGTLWLLFHFYQMQFYTEQLLWVMIAVACYNFMAVISNLYIPQRGRSNSAEVWLITYCWFCVAGILLLLEITKIVNPHLQNLFWLWLTIVPIELISWHLMMKIPISWIRRTGHNSRLAAIVGVTEVGKEVESIITQYPSLGIKLVGYYDSREPEQAGSRIKVSPKKFRGNYKKLLEDARSGKIDIVYIALPMMAENRIKSLIDELSDTTLSVFFVPDLLMFDLLRGQWYSMYGIPVISIFDTPFYGIDGAIKRIFDIVFAIIVLLIIIIPMLLIAVAIKIDSKGPIFFKQRRYGIKGEEILVWKFRTMKVMQDGDNVPQAQRNDPRITRLGRYLRSTSLDELPQFINVIQGRMSVVGPRPHAVAHNELYRGQVKGYMLRHKVKPGITGLAQVNGFRGETETLDKMEGRVKYDLDYICDWSILLDIKIIFLTIYKGILCKNAF